VLPVLVSAGVGALAAGLSAMWNGVIAPMLDKVKHKQEAVESVTDGGEAPTDEGK
jgi:hypothetical protein